MENIWPTNGTTPFSEESASTQFLIFNCSILTLTFLVGISGNLLVFWVVFRNKTLQTANNALLVNLAASDFIKCSLDTPVFLASLHLGTKRAEIGAVLCCLQQFTYSLCSCAQLLTLVVISMERFQAIAFPFKTEKRKGRIRIWIIFIWICALFLAILSLSLSKDSFSYMMCRHIRTHSVHASHSDPFGAYVLVPIWGCSLILIIVHYLRIFVVVRQHTNKIFDRGIELRASTTVREVLSWESLSVSAPRTSPTQLPKSGAGESAMDPPLCECAVITGSEYSSYVGKSFMATAVTTSEIVGAVCILTTTAKELGKKRLEGKLAKRFGYIIITFSIFWVPLVVTLILNKFVKGNKTSSWVLRELETSAMVLTCIPAAVDPLIYTLVNRQFRSEFQKLLSILRTCLRPQG